MREPMDVLGARSTSDVVIAKAAQVGYTEMLNNVIGFYIDTDPCPILLIEPNLELAATHSKDRLAPMFRDTPILREKVHDPKSRDADNTILQKVFPGGRLTLIGANAPSGLSARPIRIVIGDEVDRWPLSAGTEGDPLMLASKRQITFWNRKRLIGSTPVLEATSVIWREFKQSDMRRYHVPCQACGTLQVMKWSQVRWAKSMPNEKNDESRFGRHKPETAHFVCEHCGAVWTDADRHEAVRSGEWVAGRPHVIDKVGFHIPGFLSPWLTLEDIVKEFLLAKDDPHLLQVWTNTVLGEPFEGGVEKIDATAIISRAENYGPEALPDSVLLVVASVDVQDNRLEALAVGFGLHEETWAISHDVILGDPATKAVWDDLDHVLLRKFKTESGRELRIRATCVDSGGHATAAVMAYARARVARRVYAIKGRGGPHPIWPRAVTRTKKNKGDLYLVGVDTAKDSIYGRLMGIKKHGPGYMHFPIGAPFDQRFFDQLASEQVRVKFKDGKPKREWFLPSGRRNEALDLYAYALAARHSLRIRLDKLAEVPAPRPIVEDEAEQPLPIEAPQSPDQPGRPLQQQRPGGWFKSGGGGFGRGGGGWFGRR